VKVDADGVRQAEMPNVVLGGGQCSHGAAAKAQRILRKVVVVKHAPGPTDDGVGVHLVANTIARNSTTSRSRRATIDCRSSIPNASSSPS